MYVVEFYPDVKKDLDRLPDEIAREVREYFYKYSKDPYAYSKPLFNQGSLKLEGYRKTYVADATYRIVIKIENNVAKIVEVVAVGPREDKKVYMDAAIRIDKNS